MGGKHPGFGGARRSRCRRPRKGALSIARTISSSPHLDLDYGDRWAGGGGRLAQRLAAPVRAESGKQRGIVRALFRDDGGSIGTEFRGRIPMKRGWILTAVLSISANVLAAENVLRVSAIPDEAPTELQRKFEPLGAYLEKATGWKVHFVPVTDYAATVEGLAAKKLDLVWYGGFTFVQARRRTGNAIPLVQREEDAHFHSKFIVASGSKAKSLADLKGANFAFGSVSSTSGHLMPRFYLLKKIGRASCRER